MSKWYMHIYYECTIEVFSSGLNWKNVSASIIQGGYETIFRDLTCVHEQCPSNLVTLPVCQSSFRLGQCALKYSWHSRFDNSKKHRGELCLHLHFISPFWFANTAAQKRWLCRGQIYPFNMRGLTNFYVTDPLETHWLCSSSVAGIKWIWSWGVAAMNCCEIPDKLSFSGRRTGAEIK